MARKKRPEISFGSGSFLDVLCNMVGILIILIAVVGMRVADKDDPVIDMAEPEASIPEPPQVDPAVEARRLENEARLARHRQALLEHEEESRNRQSEWQRLLAEMQSRNQELDREAELIRQRILVEAAALEQDEARKNKLVEMVAAASSENDNLRKNETDFQQQAIALMQERKNLQVEIEAQKVAQAIRKPVFEIVAHDGNSGTNRRPILIECRADGVEFASEKVYISARTLNEFSPERNPLLAGADALMTYWTLADAKKGETQLKPYVLLIVRPGGTVGFYVARRYLEAMNQEFGYELVPDGADIKWPEADPEATEICRTAVERAIKEPASIATRGSLGPGSKGGGGRDPVRGGNSSRPGTGRGAATAGGLGGADDQIVGADGEFSLPEVEQLKKASPKDSIGMLGPDWSPQRQKLESARPGQAGQQNRSQLEQDYAEELARRNGTGTEEGTTGGTTPGSRPGRPTTAGNAGATGANGSGFQLQPYGDQGNPRGGMSSGESNGTNSSGSSSSGGQPSSQRPDMPVSPLAEKQEGMPRDGGRDRTWGRGYTSGAIGIEREIVMQLYAERIVIVEGPSADLPPGIGREDFHQIVAAMIQVQANSWGDPPAKFVWRPRLKIEIHPGGNQHYARLKELLQHWGLSSKIELKLE
ncbi:hypothetical protein SH661x_003410 [Planctomicrobium sp. SH661]|uniref:hypothetical protein n=1 Tax=Planctomicrobium sp. SH661 TaxID=3448124 RepID=UPI003F5B62F7